MACSVYCAQFLLEVCFEYGLEDHARKLTTDDSKRSWLNMLRAGATMTIYRHPTPRGPITVEVPWRMPTRWAYA